MAAQVQSVLVQRLREQMPQYSPTSTLEETKAVWTAIVLQDQARHVGTVTQGGSCNNTVARAPREILREVTTMPSIIFQILLLGLLCVLPSCKVGPDYQRPATTMPARYASTQPGVAADLTRWWDRLGDPQLASLVARASDASLMTSVQSATRRFSRHSPWGTSSSSIRACLICSYIGS